MEKHTILKLLESNEEGDNHIAVEYLKSRYPNTFEKELLLLTGYMGHLATLYFSLHLDKPHWRLKDIWKG